MIFYFDNINKNANAGFERKSIPYDKYFGEMEISEESKEHRKQVAKAVENACVFLFTLIPFYANANYTDEIAISLQFEEKIISEIGSLLVIDDGIKSHISRLSREVTRVTIENFTPEENYFTSDDRAMFIAECESNFLVNYEELEIAILEGFTNKVWHTMEDSKVRKGHKGADNQVRPIDKPFNVDGEKLMFPTDDSLGASARNTINCRCSVEYI